MAATLQEVLLAPDNQPTVVADCYELLQLEVSELSGISGSAIKLAYNAVMKFKPDHIRFMVGELLPTMIDKLQPYWTEFDTSGDAEFGDYLAARGSEVAESLLTVTDERCEGSGRPVVIKAYRSVRSSAARHIEAALPRAGSLVQKHAS
jgi:hypothetical protein